MMQCNGARNMEEIERKKSTIMHAKITRRKASQCTASSKSLISAPFSFLALRNTLAALLMFFSSHLFSFLRVFFTVTSLQQALQLQRKFAILDREEQQGASCSRHLLCARHALSLQVSFSRVLPQHCFFQC